VSRQQYVALYRQVGALVADTWAEKGADLGVALRLTKFLPARKLREYEKVVKDIRQ